MIKFIQLIFEFVVFQVLINAIKGILFIFFLQKSCHYEYGLWVARCLGTPMCIKLLKHFLLAVNNIRKVTRSNYLIKHLSLKVIS